jgi:uncharacterized membrane protein
MKKTKNSSPAPPPKSLPVSSDLSENGIPASLQQLLEHIPEEERQEFVARQVFSGPLPSPEVLARYQDVLPGLAGKIVDMAEAEQKVRHQAVLVQQRQESAKIRWAGMVSFVIPLAVLGLAAYAIKDGYRDVAGLFGTLGVLGVIIGAAASLWHRHD